MRRREDETIREFLSRVMTNFDFEDESVFDVMPSVACLLDYAELWSVYDTDLLVGIIESIEEGDDPGPFNAFVQRYGLPWNQYIDGDWVKVPAPAAPIETAVGPWRLDWKGEKETTERVLVEVATGLELAQIRWASDGQAESIVLVPELLACLRELVEADGDYYTDAEECSEAVGRLQACVKRAKFLLSGMPMALDCLELGRALASLEGYTSSLAEHDKGEGYEYEDDKDFGRRVDAAIAYAQAVLRDSGINKLIADGGLVLLDSEDGN